MILIVPCMECQIQDGVPGGFTLVTYQESGRYVFTCSKGHKTVTILQAQKFEVLFEIGANAINDGYFREAVTSFASSRERFYEFAIRVLLGKLQPGKPDLFDHVWRPIRSQSERQLGAFVTTWAACFGENPSMLAEAEVGFRNDVVHKGRIPTREEAVAFGQRILDLSREQINRLRAECEAQIMEETHRHLMAARTPADKDFRIATSGSTSIIGLYVSPGDKHHARSLEEALIEVAKWRKMLEELRGVDNFAQLLSES